MGAMESQELDEIADAVTEAFGGSKSSSNDKESTPNQPKNPHKGGLELLAEWIETEQAKNIVVLTGAGISTGNEVFSSPFSVAVATVTMSD